MNSPKKIYHINGLPTDNRKLIIDDVIQSFSMRQNEAKLLRFYALNCSDGFAPAKAYITKMTGMDRRNILKSRELLNEDTLIKLGKTTILVDWENIKLFASLKDEVADDGTPAIAKQRKNRIMYKNNTYLPVNQEQYDYIQKLLNNPVNSPKRKKGLDIMMSLTMTPVQMANYLGTLSDEQYDLFKKNIKDFNKHKKSAPILYTTGNCLGADYSDEDSKFLMEHLGPYNLAPNDYSVLEQDNETWNKIMHPESYIQLPDEHIDMSEYIATYDLPF